MKAALLVSVVAIACASGAQASVSYAQNAQHQTTSIAGLNDDGTCERRAFAGRVVSRRFDADAVTLREFVIERLDGRRDHINVDAPSALDGVVSVEIIDDGLQRLTKVGRSVRGYVALCGVSGEVEMLDDIR